MRWLRHVPLRLVGIYATVIAVLFVFMGRPLWSPPPAPAPASEPDEPEDAVPVFGRRASSPAESAGPVTVPASVPGALVGQRWWQPDVKTLERFMREAMPVMAVVADPAQSAAQSGRTWWQRGVVAVVTWLGGFDPSDPRSVLGAQLPVVAYAEPDEHEVEQTEPPVSFDPFDFLTRPARPRTGPEHAPGYNPNPTQLGQSPVVAFYSTHAYESYMSEMMARPKVLGDVTSWENSRNIVRVAGEMARVLYERHGISTIHSAAHHNQEGTGLSYKYSRLTAQRILKEFSTVRMLIDVHRDSAERGPETVATIKGEPYARVMLVAATGDPDAGLAQPHALKTVAFAKEILRVMEQKYPGLARQLLVRKARYNQDLMPASILFEIGGPENSMDEALRSARAMADVLAEVIKSGRYPTQ